MNVGDHVRMNARLYSNGFELYGCTGTVHRVSPEGVLVSLESSGPYFWLTLSPDVLTSAAQELDQTLAAVNQ